MEAERAIWREVAAVKVVSRRQQSLGQVKLVVTALVVLQGLVSMELAWAQVGGPDKTYGLFTQAFCPEGTPPANASPTPVGPVAAPLDTDAGGCGPFRSCCVCFYYPIQCTATTETECRKQKDCYFDPDEKQCKNIFKNECEKWLESQDHCNPKEMIETTDDRVVPATDAEGKQRFPGELPNDLPIPKGCQLLNMRYAGHGRTPYPDYSCKAMDQQLRVCLKESPNCQLVNFGSSMCSVFKDIASREAWLSKLASDNPNVMFWIDGSQDYTTLDSPSGVCTRQTLFTLVAWCQGQDPKLPIVNRFYRSCDNPMMVCSAFNVGETHWCLKDPDRKEPPIQRVCCKKANGEYQYFEGDTCPPQP